MLKQYIYIYISNFINEELQNKILAKYQNIFIEENRKYVISEEKTYKLNITFRNFKFDIHSNK